MAKVFLKYNHDICNLESYDSFYIISYNDEHRINFTKNEHIVKEIILSNNCSNLAYEERSHLIKEWLYNFILTCIRIDTPRRLVIDLNRFENRIFDSVNIYDWDSNHSFKYLCDNDFYNRGVDNQNFVHKQENKVRDNQSIKRIDK